MFIYESLFTVGTAEWFITSVSLFMLPHFCCFDEPLFMIGAAVLKLQSICRSDPNYDNNDKFSQMQAT